MAYTNTSNKLIIRESPRLSGMVDTNHLSRFAQTNPMEFDTLLNQTFSSMQISVDPFNELTFGANRVKILTGEQDTWTWKQSIRPRPFKVSENLEGSNTAVGIDGTYFSMKFDVDYLSPGMVISPNDKDLIRISQNSTGPFYETGGYVYRCQIVTDNPLETYPQELMATGTEYVQRFPVYSEQSAQAADLNFSGIITLQDSLGDMMRLQHKNTGYVQDMTLEFEWVEIDPQTGKQIKSLDKRWMSRAEVKFWKAMDMFKGQYLFYGKGAKNLDGEKGFKTRTNYGLKYQMENWGNVETYNTLSAKLIREYLSDIYIGRIAEGQRNVTFFTGEQGFMLFDDAMKNEANKFLIDSDRVLTGSDLMSQAFGYQIKEYRLINGGVVRLQKLPYLDVDITNSMRDSRTGYIKQSANFYVMDFTGGGQDNLWVVKRDNSLQYGYQVGTRAPWELKGQAISVLEDAFTLIARDRCSPWIKDVTRTGALLFRPL